MAYNPTDYRNKPDQTSPINATNLNHGEQGIAANDVAITALTNKIMPSSILNIPDAETLAYNYDLNNLTYYGAWKAVAGVAASLQHLPSGASVSNNSCVVYNVRGGGGSVNFVQIIIFSDNPDIYYRKFKSSTFGDWIKITKASDLTTLESEIVGVGNILASDLAKTFSVSVANQAGDYVIYENVLYKITADREANTTWANTKKEVVKLADVVKSFFDVLVEGSDTLTLSLTNGYYVNNNGVVGTASSSAWKRTAIYVNKGESYYIKTITYQVANACVMFVDFYNNILESYLFGTGASGYHDIIVSVPDNAERMLVNCSLNNDSGAVPMVKNIVSKSMIESLIEVNNSENLYVVTDSSVIGSKVVDIVEVEGNNYVKFTNSSVWKYAVKNVNVGEHLYVTTTGYSNVRYDWIFTDDSGKVISHANVHPSSATVVSTVKVVVPENASMLYVNCRSTGDIIIKEYYEVFFKREKQTGLTTLKMTSINCGTFDHYRPGGGSYTEEEYLQHWKEIINRTDFDMFVLVDCPFASSGSPYTESDMFGGIVRGSLNQTNAKDQYIEYRQRVGSSSVLFVTSSVTVDGVTYTNTNRRKFLKTTYEIGEKIIAIYAIHATPQLSSGYENLRAAQFADLIEDASNYDGAIMLGDFNCQTKEEYDIFKNAGYKTANCGYLGTFNTLRNIPADNIIVSNNMVIRKFEVIDSPELNSDHLPISAIVQFIG